MVVEFDKSFLRYLKKIKDKPLLDKLDGIVTEIEESGNLEKVKNCVKLSGFKNYYRIRIGDFRLGIEVIDAATVRLIIIAHRKDIYRNFP